MLPLGANTASAMDAGQRGNSKWDYGAFSPSEADLHFSDTSKDDPAYGLLAAVSTGQNCGAESTRSALSQGVTISRFEAAALVSDCLTKTTTVTDGLKRLLNEYANELSPLGNRAGALTQRINKLEAQQFSTTTKFKAHFATLFGGSAYYGAGAAAVSSGQRNAFLPNNSWSITGPNLGAPTDGFTISYDLQLNLDTSFSGKDLLKIRLEAGNMTYNAFGLASATPLSYYTWLFPLGQPDNTLVLNRFYYSFPLNNELRLTVGPKVRQDDLIGNWPGRYPSEIPLFGIPFYAGSPGAYNLNLGSGAGLTWNKPLGGINFVATTAYVAANGNIGNPASGGLLTAGAGGSFTTQISTFSKRWNIAAVYTLNQNGVYLGMGTPQYNINTTAAVNSYGIGGYYDFNTDNRYLPIFNAGAGYNTYTDPNDPRLAAASWYVGLAWNRLITSNQDFGFSFGQPTFVTAQRTGSPDDGNYFVEVWYRFQLSDHISITPALLWLSRPYGMQTTAITGSSTFSTLAAFIKTTLKF